MPRMKLVLFSLLCAAIAAHAADAPDEDKLGKAKGYPIGTAKNWFFDESVRVGSFSAQSDIPGIFNGKPNVLAASTAPMPLPHAEKEPRYRWTFDRRYLTVDDYLARQRIMGLMIIKDGVIQVEVTVDLAPYTDRILLDNVAFLQGITYTVGAGKAQVMREVMQRTWTHQAEIDGKSENFYRRTRGQRVIPAGNGAAVVSNLLRA